MNGKGSQTNIFKWIKKYEEKTYNYEKFTNCTELLSEFKNAKISKKNLASEDSRRPLPEILHDNIDFINCSKFYILGSEWSQLFIDFFKP